MDQFVTPDWSMDALYCVPPAVVAAATIYGYTYKTHTNNTLVKHIIHNMVVQSRIHIAHLSCTPVAW